MRVPPYYNRPGWQRFLSGFCIGIVFGWLFFLALFGIMYEKQVKTIEEQEAQIRGQKEMIMYYEKVQKEQNQENAQKLVIEKIQVEFLNAKELKLTELDVYELRQAVEKELQDLINKDIGSVTNTKEYILKAIEHKSYETGEMTYNVKVRQLYLTTTVEIFLELKLLS
ncbi:sporulation membrane protein YtrI [Bacillus taeanensis]|uniref:Sporulation membrane protein YtrI C-terminal domain-containing protein n=1 Tax=Bacillus taeanensis TaxID=273032 RepID=A0A366Y392_9BACI|nr:sporulation membrane protein YtrI [Bacillus taeanensis]RBW71479.1 hypothetical protein DS031_01650 [Bacillus taeanensis]